MVKIIAGKKLIASILLCQLAGVIGSLFTGPAISNWYIYLNKPPIAPPNWLFAPVWFTLYLLMAVSFYLIWRQEGKGKNQAVWLFLFHLFLNSIWSVIFFGLREIGWALAEIILLWVVIIAVMIKFYSLNKKSAWLLLPYLAWVSFASFLNYQLLILNS